MERFKIVDSKYDEFSGISLVTILYKNKTYTGVSRLHREDAPYASKFTGCRYAKEKAIIKALKDERNEEKAKCEEIRKFVLVLQSYAAFDKDSPTAKCIFKQLNKRIKKVNKLTMDINKRLFCLDQDMKKQDIVNDKIKNKG